MTRDLSNYTDRYVEQYQQGAFETVLVEIRRRHTLEALRAHPHTRVLEIGCGLEPLFPFVEDAERYVVVEPSTPFVANARGLARGRSNVIVRQAFLEDAAPELDADEFDFVIVSSLLHEVPDPSRFLASIASVCRSHTGVHFNVPNVQSVHRLLAVEMGLIGDVFEESATERTFERQTRFDSRKLAAMLEAAGFRVTAMGTYFVKPFTHAQMGELMAHPLFGERLIRGLEGLISSLPGLGCEIFANAMLNDRG